MAVVTFTLSEEAVTAFRDALICLGKFSEDVSLEARKDSFMLTTLNASKSAYVSFKFATNRFFSRSSYQYQSSSQKFFCSLYIRALISIFRSRSSVDAQRDNEKSNPIDRCEIAIEDGEGVKSRFIARIVFRNGLASTHRLPFEHHEPVHGKFSHDGSPHHWTISSRTLRQLMDHFGPGTEYLDINTDGQRVNFTYFSERTVSEHAVLLKKPLQTSISVEADEFDDIDVEDKLHIVIPVKDFRAIVQHAGSTGNAIEARYSLPSRPIQFSYSSDAISCKFLISTVGQRGGSNPEQKTKKKHGKTAAQHDRPRLEATSRSESTAPSEAQAQAQAQAQAPQQPGPPPPQGQREPISQPPPPGSVRPPSNHPLGAAGASAARLAAFDLRPSQRLPPPTLRSESLFVEDEGWEPVRDDAEDDYEDARLEWDHSANPNSFMHTTPMDEMRAKSRDPPAEASQEQGAGAGAGEGMEESTCVQPTQKLSDVQGLALFPD